MFERILIAYDGSEHSQRAAKIAGEIARMQNKVEIWLVCVMESIPPYLGQPYLQELIVAQTHAGEEFLKKARKIIGNEITIHDELLFGPPAERILNVAENRDCNLIVMGTRGLSVLQGLLLGGQVHKVISHSKCPVLAVK
jgi:nucleotide-binding universal stress UspA family protein